MNLYLIGYRGCGKSTVGSLLAKELDWTFVDTDGHVEAWAGTTIAEIFSSQGETAFREMETSVLQAFATQSRHVVATGGGLPLASSNQKFMMTSGKVIWLSASPECLWKRINQDPLTKQNRPNLTDQGGLDEVREVLSVRTPIYDDCSDFTLDVESLTPDQIVERILEWLRKVDE